MLKRFLAFAILIAAIACGRESATAPVPTANISGNWSGTINSSRAGHGTMLLILDQHCLSLLPPGSGCQVELTGKWTTIFPNPTFSDSGSVWGTVQDSTTTFSLAWRDPNICPLSVTAVVKLGRSINGTLGGQICIAIMILRPDSGTVSLSKVEGVTSR